MPIVALPLDATGLDALTTVYTWLTTNIGTLVTTIVSTPLLLLGVGIWGAGAVIGLAQRLIHS